MKIIIRRQEDYLTNHYCLLEFTGRFEGDQGESRSLVSLGTLERLEKMEKGKKMYRIEMGTIDVLGIEADKLEQNFLYTESEMLSQNEKLITIKGIVSKKIIFNKRPSPNLDRISDDKPKQEGYAMFKQHNE